jgi:hypothetical protein
MTWVLEKIEGTPYTRLKGVPLVSTGIDYKISTHPEGFTISEDMLADAVLALNDPAIVEPRMKLGHQDPRFDSAEFDGEPAVGRVENLELSNNGQTITGDYVTFDWLAEMIPLAYPSRSVEAGMGVQPVFLENHETATGKKYRMVLTGVALLGITWPGCSTLDDLQLLSSGEGVTVKPQGGQIEAAMNIEDVRTSYYDHLDALGSDYHWWWIRGMRLDPNELVVDDNDGHLFRVPFMVDGDGVGFREPVPVVVDYKDVPAEVAAGIYTEALLGGRQEQGEVVLFASRAESRPESNEGGQMDRKKLCSSLGLPEDATDGDIREKLASGGLILASAPGEEEAPPPEEEQDPDPDDTESDPDPEAEPEVQAGLPRTVTVEAGAFAQMQNDAALARSLHEKDIKRENDSIMASAVAAGKFAPAVAAAVRKQLENPATRDEARKWIAECAEGVVPVNAIGTTSAGEESDETNVNDGLPWFSKEHNRAVKLSSADTGTVQSDRRYARDGEILKAGVN